MLTPALSILVIKEIIICLQLEITLMQDIAMFIKVNVEALSSFKPSGSPSLSNTVFHKKPDFWFDLLSFCSYFSSVLYIHLLDHKFMYWTKPN